MNSPDEQERRTREARLLVSRPEEVLKELKNYGAQTKIAMYGDAQLEKTLFERGDPLVDLGLACYGTDRGIVGALYKKAHAASIGPSDARYLKGLRIACLSNEFLKGVGFKWGSPSLAAVDPLSCVGLDNTKNEDFTGELVALARTNAEEQSAKGEGIRRLFADGDLDEAEALLCNAHVEDCVLEDLYAHAEPFLQLPEDRWRRLVMMSAKNTRLRDCRETDEDPDLGLFRIQDAIFTLLENAPVTELWLLTLYQLLSELDPHHVASPDQIDHVLQRWSSVTIEGNKRGPRLGHHTSLEMKDEFRCVISSLYGRPQGKKPNIVPLASTAPDVAVRCAYYGGGDVKIEEMPGAFSRDQEAFVLAALNNCNNLFLDLKRRALLETYLSGWLIDRYHLRCTQVRKRRPWWDPAPASQYGRDLLGGLVPQRGAELVALETLNQQAQKLENKVRRLATLVLVGFVVICAVAYFK